MASATATAALADSVSNFNPDVAAGVVSGVTDKNYSAEELVALQSFKAKLKPILDEKLAAWQNAVNEYKFPADIPVQLTRHWSFCLDELDKQQIPCHALSGELLADWSKLDTSPSKVPFQRNWPNYILIRFLRARKLHLDKAIELFIHYLHYRSCFGEMNHLIIHSSKLDLLLLTNLRIACFIFIIRC
jgi:hypothetical protein